MDVSVWKVWTGGDVGAQVTDGLLSWRGHLSKTIIYFRKENEYYTQLKDDRG